MKTQGLFAPIMIAVLLLSTLLMQTLVRAAV
jgi:hypothetical protein